MAIESVVLYRAHKYEVSSSRCPLLNADSRVTLLKLELAELTRLRICLVTLTCSLLMRLRSSLTAVCVRALSTTLLALLLVEGF